MDYTKSMGYLNTYAFKAKLTARSYGGKKFYRLWVKSAARLKEFPLSVWGKLMKKSSLYILDVFKKNCTPEAHRFLSAVFLGRRELLGPEKDFFVNTGLSHLLAISGLHIGLTALILFFMLGFFISSFRARLLISLLFLYFYTFLSGASPSTLRAAIMYSTFALGFFAKRRVDILNSLSLAGFIILLFEPHSLFSIGFQLSFLSVLGIILGFKVFPIKSASNLPLNYLKQIFFCSLFVTLFITPLVSYYFGRIHIFNMFYNIIFIPFFTFILGVNFLLLVFSFFPFVAQSLGAVVSGLISWFNTLIRASSFIKFSFISYTFRLWVIAIYYLFLTGILVYFSALRRSIKSLTR